MRCALLLIIAAASAAAQTGPLDALRATVLELREQHPDAYREIRGATPLLTTAKHQLRDWIESGLARIPSDGDADSFAAGLNDAIEAAGLLCEDYTRCILTSIGSLDQVRVQRERDLLVILTSTGIRCGFDDSAYVYRHNGAGWTRLWEAEQNTYTEAAYLPQMIHGVRISESDAAGERLVLTLGTKPGCSAAFQPAYVRLRRTRLNGAEGSKLLDYSELISVDGEVPVQGSVSLEDALVGFTVGGTGYGYSHRALRHFVMRGGSVERTSPIAATPRDFVEEWLAAPWSESSAYSDNPRLAEWHARLHREDGMGDFPDPAVRCGDGSWMIATHLRDAPTHYFRVRQAGGNFRYAMAAIGDTRFADCTQPDPDADRQPDLFP